MGLQPLAAWNDAYSDAQQSAQEDGFVSEDADTPVTVQKDWISLQASVTEASFDIELIMKSLVFRSHLSCALRFEGWGHVEHP